jgi:hypothetical protein
MIVDSIVPWCDHKTNQLLVIMEVSAIFSVQKYNMVEGSSLRLQHSRSVSRAVALGRFKMDSTHIALLERFYRRSPVLRAVLVSAPCDVSNIDSVPCLRAPIRL